MIVFVDVLVLVEVNVKVAVLVKVPVKVGEGVQVAVGWMAVFEGVTEIVAVEVGPSTVGGLPGHVGHTGCGHTG